MDIILTYTLSLILVYIIANWQYRANIIQRGEDPWRKLSWINVIIFTFLFVGVNYIYTYLSPLGLTSDRINYRSGYAMGNSPSAGLMYLQGIIKSHGFDFYEFTLFITALSLPLFFGAYKLAKNSTPLMLLFFMLTPYITNGYGNFKQTFANGFACMLFSLLTYKRTLLLDFVCVLMIVLGCAFHPSAFILIVFFILYRMNFSIQNLKLVFFIMLLCSLILPQLLMFIAVALGSAVPFLSNKIIQYFAEDSEMGEGRIIVAFKGLAYFYITLKLMLNKQVLSAKIDHFGFYLIASGFVCLLYFLSYFNVWMPRMAELFFFPVLMCWANSIKLIPHAQFNVFITTILIGFFTYRLMWLCFVSPIQ